MAGVDEGGGGPSGASHTSQPPDDYGTIFTNPKAGMDGVDKQKIKDIVYSMSKGSEHFKNEQRKAAAVEARLQRMRMEAATFTPVQLAASQRSVEGMVAELEAARDLTRTWLHVDMDAFFAAVEVRDNPGLATKPFAVGHVSMICTANYVARTFGVRSAMPGFIALKLCPHLHFVKPNFEKYTRASQATRAIFADYDPDFESGSLDEAYLDVTDYCALHGVSGGEVARDIRTRMRAETQLTCSVGVAPNRMLAKICSDRNKPDGQCCLAPERGAVLDFVQGMSLRKIPGIGQVTERILNGLGITMCNDIRRQGGMLALLFTRTSLEYFLCAALGVGTTRHAPRGHEGAVQRRGLSVERTFRPIAGRAEQEAKCVELAGMLAEELSSSALRGRTLTLKLKTTSFELRTRALTHERCLTRLEDIQATALKLLRAEPLLELRLMGLRMSSFVEAVREPGQKSLDELFSARLRGSGTAAKSEECERGAGDGAHGGAAERGEDARPGIEPDADPKPDPDAGIHTSQEMGEGELLELTLQDWGAEGATSQDAASEPRDAAAPRADDGSEPSPHREGTTGDPGHDVVFDAHALTASRAAPAAPRQDRGDTSAAPSGADGARSGWACNACTFINAPSRLICEMCTAFRRSRSCPDALPSAKRQRGDASRHGEKARRRHTIMDAFREKESGRRER